MALKIFCCPGVCEIDCPGFLYNRGEREDDWNFDDRFADATGTKEDDHLKIVMNHGFFTYSRWGTEFPSPFANVHTIRVRWSLEQTSGTPPVFGRVTMDGEEVTFNEAGPFSERDDFFDVSTHDGSFSVEVGVVFGNGSSGDQVTLKIFEVELICD